MRGMKTMSSEGATVAEDSTQMVLKLQKCLAEREERHWAEREKLLERIQQLERTNMQQTVKSQTSMAQTKAGKSWVTNFGGGIHRKEPEPKGVAAQIRGGLN